MEDSEILAQLEERKESAVSEMLNKYGKICRKIAGNMLHSNEDAEEVVNDALLTAWNRIPPETPLYLCAFLCKITRNLSLKRLEYRTAKKRAASAEAVSLDELAEVLCSKEDSPEEQCDAAALAKAISDFLNQQKLRNQQLFVRRYYAADSLETLAEEFDMSENSIAAVLLRMRKKLAAYLDDNGFDTAR